MLTKRIIPCLDVDAGRVVKGEKFINLRDAGDPVALAKFYDAEGADELCFLDITASSDKRDTVIEMVEKVASQVFIPFTVGGGIRSVADAQKILRAGADKIAVNTAAVERPELIRELSDAFGAQNVVLAIDARRKVRDEGRMNEELRIKNEELNSKIKNSKFESENSSFIIHHSSFEVVTHGGRTTTNLDAVEWARRGVELGAGEILLTSMDADGTKNGFDLALTRAVASAVSVSVIASGGAGKAEDFFEVFTETGADAGLAATIFHFKETSIAAIKKFLAEKGVRVRR